MLGAWLNGAARTVLTGAILTTSRRLCSSHPSRECERRERALDERRLERISILACNVEVFFDFRHWAYVRYRFLNHLVLNDVQLRPSAAAVGIAQRLGAGWGARLWVARARLALERRSAAILAHRRLVAPRAPPCAARSARRCGVDRACAVAGDPGRLGEVYPRRGMGRGTLVWTCAAVTTG